MNIAVVTGASSGIGSVFAEKIASDPSYQLDEIWLIARRKDRLKALAQHLCIPARVIPVDLADARAAETVAALLQDDTKVSVLVNNAGVGADGGFSSMTAEALQTICDLNIRAATMLLRLLSPHLKKGSVVFNLSSVAAFLPQPGFAAYAASKSYLLSLSRALSSEWKQRGVTVVAVCPNPVDTEFFRTKDMTGKMPSGLKRLGQEKVEHVVDKAILNGKRGRSLSVSSPMARLIHLAANILPTRLLLWGMQKLNIGAAEGELR